MTDQTAAMTDQLSIWRTDHANFARLLALLEQELSLIEQGEPPDHSLMADVVSYLHLHADRAHHPLEELAFERMMARDPALTIPIGRLRQEHRVLSAAGAELLERLRQLASDVVSSREPVESAAATFLVYYRHHLMVEERELLPRAAQLLTDDDWADVVRQARPGADPLFGDPPEQRFVALRRRLAMDADAG